MGLSRSRTMAWQWKERGSICRTLFGLADGLGGRNSKNATAPRCSQTQATGSRSNAPVEASVLLPAVDIQGACARCRLVRCEQPNHEQRAQDHQHGDPRRLEHQKQQDRNQQNDDQVMTVPWCAWMTRFVAATRASRSLGAPPCPSASRVRTAAADTVPPGHPSPGPRARRSSNAPARRSALLQ
jgi:hypothetical protein